MRVAVCQLNARDDREANLATARDLLERAADAGADLAVLPEYTDYLGRSAGLPEPEPVDGEYARFFAKAARELSMWVHAGSFHEAGPDPAHTYNTSIVFDRSGELAGVYRKIHLYDVEIPGRVSYHESATVAPGDAATTVTVEGVPVGLSTCYDLRFPELLLRARAIENQCYVLAAAQIGDHDPGRTCYGRSMVIDPWGTVLAQAPDTVGVTVADLDLDRLAAIRAELPSLANRRLPIS
jgi:predicted amidohydrolase